MRTYLLLRNNRRSGPYSHREMVDKGLSGSDLVWVEGESLRWKHPFELDGFRHVPPPGASTAPSLPPVLVRFPVQRLADEACPVPTLALYGVRVTFMAPATRRGIVNGVSATGGAGRRVGPPGKGVRRTRRKHPHDVDLSLLLTGSAPRHGAEAIQSIVQDGLRIVFAS